MKKLLSILSSACISFSSTTISVSCLTNNNKVLADLSTIETQDLNLEPPNNTKTAAQRLVLEKIKTLFSIDIKPDVDFVYTFESATSQTPGVYKIMALEKSEKIKGIAVFNTKYVETNTNHNTKKDISSISKKDLGTIEGYYDLPKLEDIIKVISTLNSGFYLTTQDVQFDSDYPTTTKASLSAKSDSALYEGSVVVNYTYVKKEFKKVDLSQWSVSQVLPNSNTLLSVKSIVDKKLKTLAEYCEADVDYTVSEYKNSSKEKAGSVKVSAIDDSIFFTGEKTIEVQYNENPDENADKEYNLYSLQGDDLILAPSKNSLDDTEALLKEFLLKKFGVDLVEGRDYQIVTDGGDFKNPTKDKDGRILIMGFASYNFPTNALFKVKGAALFKILLSKDYPDVTDLLGMFNGEIKVFGNKNEETIIKQYALQTIKELSPNAVEGKDFTIEDIDLKNKKIFVKSIRESKILSGSSSLSYKIEGEN
ncbi:hypothetical protein SHELI_v1c10170 [Spiroplasma helicoides]|uniref:Lipoprotein n=1 Tax=Spiroplasma helicoides TaxID=216938 RepID=A0A1B3SM09_9MOLU|nr:hypothetical protein [Spiroplasma helicoides]AOG60964.1 hypothetical protein SHELI_v1c10170 [Spiroplasma helicoides]